MTDKAIHPFHGEGEITQYSPSGVFAIVRYPCAHGYYLRTHCVVNITIIKEEEE